MKAADWTITKREPEGMDFAALEIITIPKIARTAGRNINDLSASESSFFLMLIN